MQILLTGALLSLIFDGWGSNLREHVYAVLISFVNANFEVEVLLLHLQSLENGESDTVTQFLRGSLTFYGIPLRSCITSHSDSENAAAKTGREV